MVKKNGRKTKNSSGQGPSPDTVVYRGPIRGGVGSVPDDTVVARVSLNNNPVGSAGGINYSANNLGVTSCSDWASFAATYGEFRIVGFEVDYLPNYPGGNAAVVHSAGFRFATHNSDSFVTPNIDTCIQHADWVMIHTGSNFRAEWKMASEEEAGFNSTASPPTTVAGSIFVNFPYATTASVYGIFVCTWMVQFRDRK